jgi:hypothetical protein
LTFHGVPDYIGSLEVGLATKGHAQLLHDPSGSEVLRHRNADDEIKAELLEA